MPTCVAQGCGTNVLVGGSSFCTWHHGRLFGTQPDQLRCREMASGIDVLCDLPQGHEGFHQALSGARWNDVIVEEPVNVRFDTLMLGPDEPRERPIGLPMSISTSPLVRHESIEHCSCGVARSGCPDHSPFPARPHEPRSIEDTIREAARIVHGRGLPGQVFSIGQDLPVDYIPQRGPVPDDVVVRSGAVMQYEPSIRVRLPGLDGRDTSCPSCQGRRWIGSPSAPQECPCATRARPVPVPFPPPPVGSVVNVPDFNTTGVQVGDVVTVNGMPAGRIMAIAGSTVTLDQEGARATADFRPISFERTMREGIRGTNPCAEIPLGNHEMPRASHRLFQEHGFSELEIATIRQVFGDNPFAEGVDPHELTKDLFLNEKGKREKLAKILQDEYSRNYRRTRFERDDVI